MVTASDSLRSPAFWGKGCLSEAVWAIIPIPFLHPAVPCGAAGMGVPGGPRGPLPHRHPPVVPLLQGRRVGLQPSHWLAQQFQQSSVTLGLAMHYKVVSQGWFDKNLSWSWLFCIPSSWGKAVELFRIENHIAPSFVELTSLKSAGDPFAPHMTALFHHSPVTKLHPENYLGIQQCSIGNGRPELENVCCLRSNGIFFFDTYVLSINCL